MWFKAIVILALTWILIEARGAREEAELGRVNAARALDAADQARDKAEEAATAPEGAKSAAEEAQSAADVIDAASIDATQWAAAERIEDSHVLAEHTRHVGWSFASGLVRREDGAMVQPSEPSTRAAPKATHASANSLAGSMWGRDVSQQSLVDVLAEGAGFEPAGGY
jgi:hypothetical protein